jgi:hypothetical protein
MVRRGFHGLLHGQNDRCSRMLSPYSVGCPMNVNHSSTDTRWTCMSWSPYSKTEHVTKSRGRHCGDIELSSNLTNTTDPVSLVMDLHIDHDRFGSRSDPSLNLRLVLS